MCGMHDGRPVALPHEAALIRPRLGLAAAVSVLALVAVSLAFEPRLAELGAPGFVDRFNLLRAAGALGFGSARRLPDRGATP